jgi:hypothetical protein
MLTGHFFVDTYQYPRAKFPAPNETLGEFLESDVQASPRFCDYLIEVCSGIRSEGGDEWTMTGNAHSVTIRGQTVRIENEFSDTLEPCEISLEDFCGALVRWRQLISQHNK